VNISGANIDLLAFLICESVARDATSGNATIQSVFDTITTAGVPALKQSMTIFLRVKTDVPQIQLSPSLVFNFPSGLRNIGPSLPPLNIGNAGVSDGTIVIQGMMFTEFGRYSIDLLLNGVQVASYPMSVNQSGVQSSGSSSRTIH
jgi:Family of unknown function (DUF6941)